MVNALKPPQRPRPHRFPVSRSGRSARRNGARTYDTEPVFAEHFDTCAAGFRAEIGIDLHAEVFGGTATNLERIDRSQPPLFTVEYALAKLVDSLRCARPGLCRTQHRRIRRGHAGRVFDLETAIKAVSIRARLLHAAPAGAMVAVAAADNIRQFLAGGPLQGVGVCPR